MKILITAGGTWEPIDEVRVITNISSGKLGAMIADEFIGDCKFGDEPEHEVFFLHSKTSVRPLKFISCNDIVANSVQDVFRAMKEYVPQVDLVIMAMAVSDFYIDGDKNIKLKGDDIDAFLAYLKDRLRVSPKIISHVKDWNPNASLVGFKFTVGKTVEEMVDIAKESILINGCDLVVANDKDMMKKAGKHIAYFVRPDGSRELFEGKEQIAKGLVLAADSVLL